MHMPLVNCISIVTDLYNIHYDGYYLKYDEIAHRKEVNFCRGAHSTNPCGTPFYMAFLAFEILRYRCGSRKTFKCPFVLHSTLHQTPHPLLQPDDVRMYSSTCHQGTLDKPTPPLLIINCYNLANNPPPKNSESFLDSP